jgi:hypothetical protein
MMVSLSVSTYLSVFLISDERVDSLRVRAIGYRSETSVFHLNVF